MEESYQVSQMGQLVPLDVPPLHVVLRGLQRQNRWFRGCALELKEEKVQTHTDTTH